jgi:hypothetical protein
VGQKTEESGGGGGQESVVGEDGQVDLRRKGLADVRGECGLPYFLLLGDISCMHITGVHQVK